MDASAKVVLVVHQALLVVRDRLLGIALSLVVLTDMEERHCKSSLLVGIVLTHLDHLLELS